MRCHTTVCLFALLLSGAIVAAQDAKGTTDTKVKADNGKVVTMTGCVEIGGGTSFVLTNDKSYSLVARKGLDLGPYIQQKVELTGVVVPAATRRDGDDKIKIKEPTAPAATTVKVARGKDAQFLVASVKTLAPTCQP
jgi:hypothetical protein